MGGFRAWLIKYIVTELFEEIAEPLIKASFRRMGYLYDRAGGKIQVKKLNEAREDNNEDSYNSSVDDIFGGSKVQSKNSLPPNK